MILYRHHRLCLPSKLVPAARTWYDSINSNFEQTYISPSEIRQRTYFHIMNIHFILHKLNNPVTCQSWHVLGHYVDVWMEIFAALERAPGSTGSMTTGWRAINHRERDKLQLLPQLRSQNFHFPNQNSNLKNLTQYRRHNWAYLPDRTAVHTRLHLTTCSPTKHRRHTVSHAQPRLFIYLSHSFIFLSLLSSFLHGCNHEDKKTM